MDFRHAAYYGRGRREMSITLEIDAEAGLIWWPTSVTVIHHLGWAVRSIDQARPHFETTLGLDFCGEESFPDVRVAFFGGGPVAVELLEPLDDKSDIGEFLAKHGEGIHHLALRVDDVAAALRDAGRHGLLPIDSAPHRGARGTLVGLVDPARSDAVLIQYVQEP
jgi:methylmalonyl-CoA/ethylmalonyl-CoA epimerase